MDPGLEGTGTEPPLAAAFPLTPEGLTVCGLSLSVDLSLSKRSAASPRRFDFSPCCITSSTDGVLYYPALWVCVYPALCVYVY